MRINTHKTQSITTKPQQHLENARLVEEKLSQIIARKSPIISRRQGSPLDSSICFISPKKIAYFKTIDENCLNQNEKTMVKSQSEKVDGATINLNNKQKKNQIDYGSIKRCLSPRYNQILKSESRMPKQQKNSKEYQCLEAAMKKEDKEAYQRMILDLKLEILEMGELLQEKQKIIEKKDAKIAQLQRQINRDQCNQTIFDSCKSLSTLVEQKTTSHISSFPFLYYEDNPQKIVELQQKIRSYEKQLKKFQIQIDMLRKYRFDRQAMESALTKCNKKNESLKRKVSRLQGKNNDLKNQVIKYRQIIACEHQGSIILQYSPEKHNIS